MLSKLKFNLKKWFLALILVFLTFSIWMNALHHHDNFKKSNDCIMCLKAYSTPCEFNINHILVLTGEQYELLILKKYSFVIIEKPLYYSPKTSPPVFS